MNPSYYYTISCVASCSGGGYHKRSYTQGVGVKPPIHTAFGITAGPTGTPNPVASGKTVQCSVTAPDTLGHTVSYGWTATGGTFSNPNAQNPIWTAPVNTTGATANYTISCVASCSGGGYHKRSYTQRVLASAAIAAPLFAVHNALLPNYPNPFNPETWIPYQLSEDSEVLIKIYSFRGELVRELQLGHKSAGLYLNRENSAYWDGRNEAGERVSSGVYFYNIQAGNYNATMKMIVKK